MRSKKRKRGGGNLQVNTEQCNRWGRWGKNEHNPGKRKGVRGRDCTPQPNIPRLGKTPPDRRRRCSKGEKGLM